MLFLKSINLLWAILLHPDSYQVACDGRITAIGLTRLFVGGGALFFVSYFINSAFFIRRLNPISYCCFKYINVYIFYSFELNAIPGQVSFAYFFPIRLG